MLTDPGLGRLAADLFLQKLAAQSHPSPTRLVVDYLPADVRRPLFEELLARCGQELSLSYPSDGGKTQSIRLKTLHLDDGRQGLELLPVAVEGVGANRVSEGFASLLRDHYATELDPARVRILITFTGTGNETQRSARDLAAERCLLDQRSLANALVARHGGAARLEKVAEVYLRYQPADRSWRDSLGRLETYLDKVDALPAERQGAALPLLGCFLPDPRPDFADGPPVNLLEDQEQRRLKLGEGRLYDNALLHAHFADLYKNPLRDPEQYLDSTLEDLPDHKVIIRGGLARLLEEPLNSFGELGKKKVQRDKNELILGDSGHQGLMHLELLGAVDVPAAVVATSTSFSLRLGLKRGFDPRKERAQIVTQNTKSNKATIQEQLVAAGATEIHFSFPAPAPNSFQVLRLALARTKNSRIPTSEVLVAIYGSTDGTVILEEGGLLSVEDQAWLVRGTPTFRKLGPQESGSLLTEAPAVPDPEEGTRDRGERGTTRVTFVESPLYTQWAPLADDTDDSEEHYSVEDFPALCAFTQKLGAASREAMARYPHHLDALHRLHEGEGVWNATFHGGQVRKLRAWPIGERAVFHVLMHPDVLRLVQREDQRELEAVPTVLGTLPSAHREAIEALLEVRTAVMKKLRSLAGKLLPKVGRGTSGAELPLPFLPLHSARAEVDALLVAWNAAVDRCWPEQGHFGAAQDLLLQMDSLRVERQGQVERLVLLPTHPLLLALLLAFQDRMDQYFQSFKKDQSSLLTRADVVQLTPRTILEDWFTYDGASRQLYLSDSHPFYLEFVPTDPKRSKGALDYVQRVVARKVERYLQMHPHLRDERRTLRLGFLNPGDGRHLLEGLKQWLRSLQEDRLRALPMERIPSLDVFLFTPGSSGDTEGAAFDQFFREGVASSRTNEDSVQHALLAKLRYRKLNSKEPATSLHLCFLHGLVAPGDYQVKSGKLDDWWDGAFGDGLLTTSLRRTRKNPQGGPETWRGTWVAPEGAGTRGALGRLLTLQRGCKDSELTQGRALYWAAPLPKVQELHPWYSACEWVIHLDRELSLEMFRPDGSTGSSPAVIEYSDQEVPGSPGFDTITLTEQLEPYRDQLAEILKLAGLPMSPTEDSSKRAAWRLLEDLNVLSGSWAIDFLLGSMGSKLKSTRLKGNLGAALAYRWIQRAEHQQSRLLNTSLGPMVPIFVSLEELLRVTPAAGLPLKDGLVYRYTNEIEDPSRKEVTKFSDDLLILYVGRSTVGEPSQLFGRVIEVKFGDTAASMREKGVMQVRNTQELLQRHLAGDQSRVDASLRNKQLSLLLKAQLEQAVAWKALDEQVYEHLNVPALSANLARGNYSVNYSFGSSEFPIVGDVILLSTQDSPLKSEVEQKTARVEEEGNVRVLSLPVGLVRWLAFELGDGTRLPTPPLNTLPVLGATGLVPPAPPASPKRRRPLILPAEPENGGTAPIQAAVAPAVPALEPATPPLGPVAPGGPAPAVASAAPAAPAAPVAPVVQGPPVASPAAVPVASPAPAEKITLKDAILRIVREAPSEQERVSMVVRRLEAAFQGHKIRLSQRPDPREADRGPRLLRVYVRLEPGEIIAGVRRVSEDLAREVGTSNPDIHISNVPERHAIGLDLPIPGLEYAVGFEDLYQHPSFAAAGRELLLGFCAGIDVTGRAHWVDLAKMPHMLVAGTTGSGKTVFLRNVLMTLLLNVPPERMILRLSSNKPMDFKIFTQVPHARGLPMAIDAMQGCSLAKELVALMEERKGIITDAMCDNLQEYNLEYPDQALPWVVAVFDEYADMVASFEEKDVRQDFENSIGRLAQAARAVGIHLVICMQRPDMNVLKGNIKANIPHRFALKLPQVQDSRVILDEVGAETLLGQGDLLYKDANNRLHRLQVPSLENAWIKKALKGIADAGSGAASKQESAEAGGVAPLAPPLRQAVSERVLNESQKQAFSLFAQGLSVDAVAARMNRARSTTQGYLDEYVEWLRPDSVRPWVTAEEERVILKAMAAVGERRATPIHEALGGAVGWDPIRVMVAWRKGR